MFRSRVLEFAILPAAEVARQSDGGKLGLGVHAANKVTLPFVGQEHIGITYRINSVWNSGLKRITVHPRRKASPCGF